MMVIPLADAEISPRGSKLSGRGTRPERGLAKKRNSVEEVWWRSRNLCLLPPLMRSDLFGELLSEFVEELALCLVAFDQL